MNRSALFAASVALTVFGLAGTSPASATVLSYTSDADFLANAAFSKSFGANSRWGNNPAANGDWEYAVVNAADAPIGPSGQVIWNDHIIHDAAFQFDGVSTARYALTDYSAFADTGTQTVAAGPGINALAFRARTGNGDTAILDNIRIVFNVDGVCVVLEGLTGDSDAEYLMLVDSRLGGGFSLHMLGALFDDGDASTNGSLPMYGLKVGSTTVPVPAAAWLFGSALGLAGWMRRR